MHASPSSRCCQKYEFQIGIASSLALAAADAQGSAQEKFIVTHSARAALAIGPHHQVDEGDL